MASPVGRKAGVQAHHTKPSRSSSTTAQAADGSVTLTAVAWESVQKVVVRQVEGLPDGMFE